MLLCHSSSLLHELPTLEQVLRLPASMRTARLLSLAPAANRTQPQNAYREDGQGRRGDEGVCASLAISPANEEALCQLPVLREQKGRSPRRRPTSGRARRFIV